MVLKLKERYSIYPEYTDSLLKYDLSCGLGGDPVKVDDMSFTMKKIGNAFHEDVLVHYSDLYKLKYIIGIDIKPLEEKMKSEFRSKYQIRVNDEFDKIVYAFLKLYHDRHLKYEEDTALAISNYLSLCEMLKLSDSYRVNIFGLSHQALLEAGVNEPSVLRKLFLFVKDRRLRKILFSTLETDCLMHLLGHLCDRHDGNEFIWNDVDLKKITNWGLIDNLKTALDYRSCVEFNPEDVATSFEDFFNISFKPNAHIIPKGYSPERLSLLLQMAYIMLPGPHHIYDSREKAIEALKICWKTIPQAYFTCGEIRDVLESIFEGLSPKLTRSDRQELEDKIQRAVEEYKRTFDVPVSEPRSLQNYARIAVRKRCRTSEAVDELVPTKRLKRYVNLL